MLFEVSTSKVEKLLASREKVWYCTAEHIEVFDEGNH